MKALRIYQVASGGAALALCGCSGWQSALDPHSAEADHLRNLFWFFTIVCAAVWIDREAR